MLSISIIDPFGVSDDPKMPFLVKAINPADVKVQFERHLSRITGESGQISIRAIRVMRYKFQRRCLIEYDLEVKQPGQLPEVITIVGKARARGPHKSMYYILESLWNADFGADCRDGISIPEPIGIISEFNMVLQRKVVGYSATRLLAEQDGVSLAKRIAEAAHKLHKVNIPVQRRHTMDDELRILHERLSHVARIKPEWAKCLDRILDACYQLGASIPEYGSCKIHRDFYPDHVIINGPNLYLIDFDLYCEGDPGLDIGNFVGHLTEQSLRAFSDPAALADREEALEERFVALSGEHTRAAVKAYTLLTLARHIYLSTQFPDRQPHTETLLKLCQQRLNL